MAKYGAMSFGVGLVAFALTFASGFGPCDPRTSFGGFQTSLGFVTTIGGSLLMIGAILRAAFGRR